MLLVHACCIFIGVIGKRFASAGLKDLIVEATVVGPSSADSTLKGKMYNRGMRVLKTVYEALQRLKMDAFENWLKTKEKLHELDDYLESPEFKSLSSTCNPENFEVAAERSLTLLQLWEEYEDMLRTYKFGPMAVFWNSFIEMVEILLD